MEKRIILLSIASLIFLSAIIIVILTGFKTGLAIIETKDFSITNNLEGTISISIEKGDSTPATTPIIIVLSKNNTIIKTKTLTFKDFIGLSNNPIQPIKNPSDSKYYYTTPSTHKVKIQKLMPHQFTEKGEYELFFNILELDLTIKKQIMVN